MRDEYIEPEPPVAQEQTPAAALPVAPAPALGEISFGNGVAVRVAFLAAGLAWFLMSLPVPGIPMVGLVWPVLAGAFAVYFYRRRTGVRLSVRAGARIGWITGIFCFAISMVLFTLSFALMANEGGLANFYRQQINGRVAQAQVEEFIQLLQTPSGLASVLFLALVTLFVLFTTLPTLGGALGAKWGNKS